jgi:uncharacterized membrane protein
MVKNVFYIALAMIVLIAIYLSIFQLLLYTFHSPFNSTISSSEAHNKMWIYLLHQHYDSFIELEPLTIHEKRHLLDVKRVLEDTYTVWRVFIAFGIVSLVLFFNKIISYVFYVGLLLNLSIILLFGYNFLASFDTFHAFFFVSNSWRFSEASLLIEIFPLNYFQEFLILFVLISSILFALLYFLKK